MLSRQAARELLPKNTKAGLMKMVEQASTFKGPGH